MGDSSGGRGPWAEESAFSVSLGALGSQRLSLCPLGGRPVCAFYKQMAGTGQARTARVPGRAAQVFCEAGFGPSCVRWMSVGCTHTLAEHIAYLGSQSKGPGHTVSVPWPACSRG